MLLDLDKFYNSNYKDFVHKEALEEALKYVPEAFLKDVDTKAVLSITFSVDDVGENPIYVTYLGKDNKEHIVKLRPNITEQLNEVLKRYPTKVEMNDALDELKATITNEYTIFVNAEVETLNNTINSINNSLTQSIKDTLDEANRYTDTKHEEALTAIEEGDTETLAASKDYTDNLKDELTPLIAENKNRLYIGNADGEKTEIEKNGHVTFEVNDGIKAIEVKQNDTEELPAERIDFDDYAKKSDIPTNTVTTDYLSEELENYETKADASIDHGKLTTVPNGHINPYISWYPNTDSNYIRIVPDQSETKLHINNSQTGLETVCYLSSRNPSNFATTTDIEPLTNKLSNIWGGHKAPFIYWLPNIDVNTMKLENTENDVKVTLNDGDVVYWRKNEYQPVDLSGIEEGDVQTLADANAYTDTQLTNYVTKADATTDHNKLVNVPSGKKEPYIRWYPNIECNHIKFTLTGTEIAVYIEKSDEGVEKVGYLSSRNPSSFATKTEAENANKVYGYDTTSGTWSKCDGNFTAFHNNSNITKLGYRQTTGGVEKTVDFNDFATKLDSLFFRGNIGAQNPSLNNLEQGFYQFYFENENTDSTYPEDMQGQVSLWGSILQMGYTNGLCTQIMIRVPGDVMYIRTHPNGSWNSWHEVSAALTNVNAEMLNLETVEAVAQEQNATNTESVAVSLRQKTRAVREVTNNSTLVNTKDFLILNLDFSFVPNTIPTSVESMFIENIAIDAPEFDGKSFDITFKANEHSVISKGVIGEPLTIKMCAFPVDETIQSVKVVVKDKIIIRKETE